MENKRILMGVLLAGLLMTAGLSGCSKSDEKKSADQPAAGSAIEAPASHANYSSLIDELKTKLKEKPGDPEITLRLGDAYFDMKQFNEAIVYYKKALEFKPGDADILNDLGLCSHYLGNSAEGLKYVEEGIKKNPYHQRIWLSKGFILAYGTGDLESAKSAWKKANSLNPESQIGKAAADFLAQFDKKK